MSRTVNVIRMQLINRQTFIWIPLIVLAGSFAVSWVIFSMIPVAGPKYGGGAQAPLWYFLVVGVQALTLTFPFSQAMSVTRRAFFVGTILTAVVTSVVLSIVFVLGGLIEGATGGWGINGYFFRLPWIWEAGIAGAALFYFAVAMLFFVLGLGFASVYKRFGLMALMIVLAVIALALVGSLWLVGQLDAWSAVFTAFGSVTAVAFSLWTLLVAAVIAGIAFLVFRRMVP